MRQIDKEMHPTLVGVSGRKRQGNAPNSGGGKYAKLWEKAPNPGGDKWSSLQENAPNPGGGT
jgi:hypothetical protein